MDFVSLLIYCVLIYIRPADWVQAVLDWPLEFVTLAFTLAIAGYRALRSDDEAGSRLPWISFILGWVVVIFLSNLVHGKSSEAMDNAVIYFKRGLIAVSFWCVLRSTNKLRGLALVLVPLGGLLGLQGMYQVEHGYGWAGQPLYWAGRICWIGLWDGANVLSLMFVFTLPFVFEILTGKWGIVAKLVALASGGLIIKGLILAGSRGGWLSLGVIILLYFRQRVGKRGLIIGAIAVASLMTVGPSRLMHNSDGDSDDASGRHRVDLWAEGLEMFKYNPVFGVGKGQFVGYTGTQVAHNAFVENMGETGFCGLFAWVGLIYLSFKSLRAVMRNTERLSPQLAGLTQAVFVSLVGYLSASMFINTDFDLLYIAMGLCAAVLSTARQEVSEIGESIDVTFGYSDMRNIALIVIAGIAYMHLMTAVLS